MTHRIAVIGTVPNVTVISPERILQLGTAFWASKTLLSAIELGLFTELAAAGPLDGDARLEAAVEQQRERAGVGGRCKRHRAARLGLDQEPVDVADRLRRGRVHDRPVASFSYAHYLSRGRRDARRTPQRRP